MKKRSWNEIRIAVEEMKAFAKKYEVAIIMPVKAPPLEPLPEGARFQDPDLLIVDYGDVLRRDR